MCTGAGESVFVTERSAAGGAQPIVYCVPPRGMSRLPFTCDVKLCPRSPTRTEPGAIADPCVTNELRLARGTFMVIVFVAVSNDPVGVPWRVYESEPSQ